MLRLFHPMLMGTINMDGHNIALNKMICYWLLLNLMRRLI